MKKSIYLLLAATLVLGSCSTKVPFTTKEQAKYKLSDNDVKHLQFYTQGDISLKNGTKDGSTKTEDGELVIKNESSLNTIFIESGTEGIVEKIEGGIMFVSFENGKNLKFKASEIDGKYRVKSDSFNARSRSGKVQYGGETFFITRTSLSSYLVFKLKNSTKRNSKQRSVKGRKL